MKYRLPQDRQPAPSGQAGPLCRVSHQRLIAMDIEGARRIARQAISLEPRNPAAHAALARTYMEEADPRQAIPIYATAHRLAAMNLPLLHEYADALAGAGREREAAALLHKSLLQKREGQGLIRLARLELEFGELASAEKHLREALASGPESHEAHALLGRALIEQGRAEDAVVPWRRAEELSPKPSDTILERAHALSAIGRFEEAGRELQRCIAADPANCQAYQALAYTRRFEASDLAIVREMERLLNEAGRDDRDRQSLCYALGRAYDNLGDFAAAIGYFDKANALRRRIGGDAGFDQAGFKARIDERIELFSKEFFDAWKARGWDSSLPILVVGMIRSGTTLMQQVLSCHPQVGGAGEQSFWGEIDPTAVSYKRRNVDGPRLRACAEQYVKALAGRAPGAAHVVDKNPGNLFGLGSLHLALPNARIIRVMRDPVDTALSIWMTPMRTPAQFVGSREDIVFAYRESLRLMDHWRDTLPSDRYLEIRYEDLVRDPAVHVLRILEFCGLDWSEACLHPERNELRIRTPSFWQVRQPLYQSSIGRRERYEPWLGPFKELDDLPHG